MLLHVLSDLHLERGGPAPGAVAADVVVLAGDIHRGTEGLALARAVADGRPVLYVIGNHEPYGHSLDELLGELRAGAADGPVHVLENEAAVIDGVRFLGCTLWSDFGFDGDDGRARAMEICAGIVNDYRYVSLGDPARRLTPSDTLARHRASRDWLAAELERPFDGDTVVITHHAPLTRDRPKGAIMRAVAGAFASDLSDLMGADRVALWIYGHTHRAADLDVDGTRVLSNPAGYPTEPVVDFDPARVVEVG